MLRIQQTQNELLWRLILNQAPSCNSSLSDFVFFFKFLLYLENFSVDTLSITCTMCESPNVKALISLTDPGSMYEKDGQPTQTKMKNKKPNPVSVIVLTSQTFWFAKFRIFLWFSHNFF